MTNRPGADFLETGWTSDRSGGVLSVSPMSPAELARLYDAHAASLYAHPRGDGWFKLYSFGEKQRDHDGVFRTAVATSGGMEEPDWVWPVAAGEGELGESAGHHEGGA